MEWYTIVLLVFSCTAFVAWPVTCMISKRRNMVPLNQTESKKFEGMVTVKKKYLTKEKDAPSGEEISYYHVVFENETAQQDELEVPQNVYEALQPEEKGLLLVQDGIFLDFDGRFGTEKIG